MATTYKNDKDFRDAMIPESSFLESAIEWIRINLAPEDVFDEKDLEEWARDSGFQEAGRRY